VGDAAGRCRRRRTSHGARARRHTRGKWLRLRTIRTRMDFSRAGRLPCRCSDRRHGEGSCRFRVNRRGGQSGARPRTWTHARASGVWFSFSACARTPAWRYRSRQDERETVHGPARGADARRRQSPDAKRGASDAEVHRVYEHGPPELVPRGRPRAGDDRGRMAAAWPVRVERLTRRPARPSSSCRHRWRHRQPLPSEARERLSPAASSGTRPCHDATSVRRARGCGRDPAGWEASPAACDGPAARGPMRSDAAFRSNPCEELLTMVPLHRRGTVPASRAPGKVVAEASSSSARAERVNAACAWRLPPLAERP
jgi:hypothetical protein